jgi:hypothetical protein
MDMHNTGCAHKAGCIRPKINLIPRTAGVNDENTGHLMCAALHRANVSSANIPDFNSRGSRIESQSKTEIGDSMGGHAVA